jgi:hypothetical protein
MGMFAKKISVVIFGFWENWDVTVLPPHWNLVPRLKGDIPLEQVGVTDPQL